MTQISNKFFDNCTKAIVSAISITENVCDEVKEMTRNQGEKIIYNMDLVRRDEFDILKEMVSKMIIQNKKLSKRIAILEQNNNIEVDLNN